MVVDLEDSWFLLEGESSKIFQCIGNYLSLGQIELARSLARIHTESERSSVDGTSRSRLSVIELLESIVDSGPPDSWICSDSVPSTAHLLSMCIDILKEQAVVINQLLMHRCEFDLMMALVFLEVGEMEVLSSECAHDLRVRFCRKVLSDSDASTLILPRILISGQQSLFSILPATQLACSRKGEGEYQLTAELNEFLFRVCVLAPQTSVGLLRLLHSVCPIMSAQLTHIQAASVAEFLMKRDWEGACFHLRFLNESAPSDVLTNAPLLVDLASLLVVIVNHQDGLDGVSEHFSGIAKFKQECLSTTFGAFPFVAKKRKFLFSLSTVELGKYVPHEVLKHALYESLSTRPSGESLIDVLAELEDVFLSRVCAHCTLPPCFDDDSPVPFWDGYFDFVRMAQVHALAYPLESAVRLIRAREFQLANKLLHHFNQLRPAAVRLCWDDFGVDIDSRSGLLGTLWKSYLERVGQRTGEGLQVNQSSPCDVENVVWAIVHRFHASVLAARFHSQAGRKVVGFEPVSGKSESVIDIMRQLPSHSLLFVIRAVLPSLDVAGLVPQLAALPAASFDASSSEAAYDLDVVRSYFVLRHVVRWIATAAGVAELSIVDELCSSIERSEIKNALLAKVLKLCVSTSGLMCRAGDNFIVELPILFSLVCLVCVHAVPPLQADSVKLLTKILVRLKESLLLDDSHGTVRCESIKDWAALVGADLGLAERCDSLSLPRVAFSAKERSSFVAPPRSDMGFSPSKFVPRLGGESDLVLTSLALNDYVLAEALATFLVPGHDVKAKITEAVQFKTAREAGKAGADVHGSGLIDLAVCGNVSSESALALLRSSHGDLPDGPITAWASKLAVLLEAKTEFTSNVSSESAERVSLAELILGIETLPNEPELLKDHLTRTHSQRSAIMVLVDRVDEVRRGQGRENADFLSEAIRRLTSEGVEGLSQQGSFLIQFLEYLSRVSALVQEAAPRAVSLFDILSEEPEDLVARVVFEHRGFSQAQALCALMHIDLLSVIEQHSRSTAHVAGRFISLEIVTELRILFPESSRPVLLCVERRPELWPSSALLDFGVQHATTGPLKRWIEERRCCWNRFVFAHNVLAGEDRSDGFTVIDEDALGEEWKAALASVATDSQDAMDSLTRMVARAHMQRGDYLSALVVLDEGLSVTDDPLCKAALTGCLQEAHSALSPERIYELLWRIDSVDELLSQTHKFYSQWESDVAVRTLQLCAHRLAVADDGSSRLTSVLHEIRVIQTMSAVAATLQQHRWQLLADMQLPHQLVDVISALIAVHEHSLACEFLEIKGGPFIDEEADRIELSRLRHMFMSGDAGSLVKRLQESHHPLKASRLALQLMDTINSVRSRTLLGDLLRVNNIACEEDADRLDTQLAALALIALTESEPLAEQWADLIERPDLVMESLLMNGHTQGLSDFLSTFPSWRNDRLVLHFVGKAIGFERGSESAAGRNEWRLTGDDNVDAGIRKEHKFQKLPDIPLALRFVSLLSSDSDSNAAALFSFVDKLSLFIHGFVSGRAVITFGSLPSGPCPFTQYVFLRQAMVSLLRVLEGMRCAQQLAVEHGRDNIDLVGELWQRCGVRVGLAALSDRTVQTLLRDTLMDMDSLDLAERVCVATGEDADANDALDVVTLHRAALALAVGCADETACILKRMHRNVLSISQLEVLEIALRNKPRTSMKQLEDLHRKLSAVAMDKKFHPNMPGRVEPKSTLTHMKGDSRNCDSCLSTDDSFDVCLFTPVAVESPGHRESVHLVGSLSRLNEQDLTELLGLWEQFGEPGSAVQLLVKEGRIEEAVRRALSKQTGRLTEPVFVSSFAAAIIDKSDWIRVLAAVRQTRQPAAVTLSYLSAVEQYLRAQQLFSVAYEFEVAMGREAQAGVVALSVYLATDSWEARAGWLASARRHLACSLSSRISKRFLQRRRRKVVNGESVEHVRINSSSSDDGEEDERRRRNFLGKISIPFQLPNIDVLTEQSILATKTLADLEALACGAVPHAPPSASLFGSVQAVSELIDFLLMERHVDLAKTVVQRLKLPDSAICGIFSL